MLSKKRMVVTTRADLRSVKSIECWLKGLKIGFGDQAWTRYHQAMGASAVGQDFVGDLRTGGGKLYQAIPGTVAARVMAAFQQLKDDQDVMSRLLNMVKTQARKDWLLETYHEGVDVHVVLENPYACLLRREKGKPVFDWHVVDQIHLDEHLGGGKKDDDIRLVWAAYDVLSKHSRTGGHCYMVHESLRHALRGYDVDVERLADVVSHSEVVLVDDKMRYVLCDVDHNERAIARHLRSIHSRRHSHDDESVSVPEGADPTQAAALREATRGGVVLITGAGGSGKTEVTAWIVQRFRHGAHVVAPTGIAAKNASERIKVLDASTVHRFIYNDGYRARLLESMGAEGFETLIVDEFSMVPVPLFAHLLMTVPRIQRLILVGHECQLPPIEYGQPLVDLLRVDWIPHIRLTGNHRVGDLHTVADMLGRLGHEGQPPFPIPGVFEMVDMEVPINNYSKDFKSQMDNLRVIRDLWTRLCDEVPEGGETPRCITNLNAVRIPLNNLLQCLMLPSVPRAFSIGDSVRVHLSRPGDDESTHVLVARVVSREVLNEAESDDFFRYQYGVEPVYGSPKNVLHVHRYQMCPVTLVQGDFVMMGSNTETYVNGDEGVFQKMVHVAAQDGKRKRNTKEACVVHLENGSAVVTAPKEDVETSYALTVHKYQGRQRGAVLFVVGSKFGERNMLYTGCSRFRERCILVGSRATIMRMARDVVAERMTRLAEICSA